MKAILGCYYTTPTAAMELEAGLMPTWIQLQTKTLLAYIYMQSLAESDPIHEWINKAKIN